MACSKYTLTNTGSTIANFNYQRCDDAMWQYQVELTPNQTKNIWLLNGTYSTAFSTSIVEVDLGVFPPLSITPTPTPTVSITPSNSPTPSVTPSNTGTVTPTPTDTPSSTTTPTPTLTQTPTTTQTGTPNTTPTQTGTPNTTPTPSVTTTNTQTPTPTQTVTPTNIVRTTQSIGCHDENTAEGACNCDQGATVFTNGLYFSASTLAWSDEFGANTGNPEGFYVQGGIVYQVATGCGPGCTTGATITVVGPCGATPTPTATPTSTPTSTLASVTPTPTGTPNVTPTNTETPTNTPTSTHTPTVTQSGTPNVTPSPTPSSFGSNTFKVEVLDSARAILNGYTLTEIPYIGTPGVGFTASTGTFPITHGDVVYGSHQEIISDTVTFELTSTGSATLTISYVKNGNFLTQSSGAVVPGSNTRTLFLSDAFSATTSDTIAFIIA